MIELSRCHVLINQSYHISRTVTHYNGVIMGTIASQITSLAHDCFLNRLFRRRSKKTSKLRVTGLCAGNSPGTGEFPAQMASNAENVSIWWRHHGEPKTIPLFVGIVILLQPLTPGDAIWHHRNWSTLVETIACCLTASSHYLSQYCPIINTVSGDLSRRLFRMKSSDQGRRIRNDWKPHNLRLCNQNLPMTWHRLGTVLTKFLYCVYIPYGDDTLYLLKVFAPHTAWAWWCLAHVTYHKFKHLKVLRHWKMWGCLVLWSADIANR